MVVNETKSYTLENLENKPAYINHKPLTGLQAKAVEKINLPRLLKLKNYIVLILYK
jgi:hypothetical protein